MDGDSLGWKFGKHVLIGPIIAHGNKDRLQSYFFTKAVDDQSLVDPCLPDLQDFFSREELHREI